MSASERLHAHHGGGEIATVLTMGAPRFHRRTNRTLAIGVLSYVAFMASLYLAFSALADGIRGGSAVSFGLAGIGGAICVLLGFVLRWEQRSTQEAVRADRAEALASTGVTLPYGVVPSGQGVRVLTRTAARVLPMAVGSFCLALAVLFLAADIPFGGPLAMIIVAASMALLWWIGRRQEIEVDGVGVRRLHWPRHQVTWTDIESVGTGQREPVRWWNKRTIDNIELSAPGKVTTAGSDKIADRILIRVSTLQVSRPDLMQLLEAYERGQRGAIVQVSPWPT